MLRDGALQGKTIVVTGGGTGLGKSMSKYFLELGANVVIASRKLPVLEETASELSALTGGKILPVACDARNYDEVENVLKTENELITSLESGGELSIRETKVMALAKAYQQLAAENVALALENVAMKQIVDSVTNLDNEPQYHDEGMGCGLEDRGITDRYDACRYGWDEAMERIYGEVIPCADELDFSATDAYLAGIKADGVEEFVSNTVHKIFDESEAVSALAYLSLANSHVKQLREGAK